MEIKSLPAIKLSQSQKWEEGKRIPVTLLLVEPCVVTQIKTKEKDGYSAVQLGFGIAKNLNKPTLGYLKKAKIEKNLRFLQEAKTTEVGNEKLEVGNEKWEVGQRVKIEEVFKVGDRVKVTGTSKGKGFAGVVKRHGFAGGPKTHGQSDRLRAPGSIGSTTTPGRVYKGKRMAGHMGNSQKTVKGLKVVEVDAEKNLLAVKGLVPGAKGGVVMVTKE